MDLASKRTGQGTSPTCYHKVGSMKLSPHHNPFPSNFTFDTMLAGKCDSPGNCLTQIHLSDCQTESHGARSPMHPTLCIALGDARLGSSSLVTETHYMKLSTDSSSADQKKS
ncbi:hypothetical protein AMECASPLE_003931 [Ameca splendens]|uniref:Uncharacterized protein n=1 Tax=Ameca splendens TaxID=208324 RepID=A0ABV1A7K1_9TELE